MTDRSLSAADQDLAALQLRALRRRQRFARSAQHRTFRQLLGSISHSPLSQPRALPARLALHLLVALIVPLAILASQVPLQLPDVRIPATTSFDSPSSDVVVPLAPLPLESDANSDAPVPDSNFSAIDALPMTAIRPDLLKPQPVAAAVAAESANVRGGPGTNYDKVGDLTAGTRLQLLSQAGGWYQARGSDNRIVWIAAELLDLPPGAADSLPEATSIPVPPPAKVGFVAEEGLNLRDGPGQAYVGMLKLNANTQLDLLARYNDWLQVGTPDGKIGWVLGQYLSIAPGVTERVEVVTSIPEASPALLGRTSDRNVSLRGGPGTDYEKIGALGAGSQLDLLGRYADWFKVRTTQGAIGWVSNELVRVDDYISRRVPLVRTIPALERPKPATQARSPRQAPPAPAAAAGNVVGYAMQFVGARYVWGASGPDAFDCSGFTQYVYKQFGLNLPHSSAGQYSTNYGTMIADPADLRAGDIVFFVNTYKRGISHVGIYIGDGNVVQALSPKLGVGVANLNGGYWAQHYYGGIRPSR